MPQDFDIVVRRLKEVINESEISYSELEKKTGISKSALHRYANGSTKKIPIDVIQAIASSVNVSAAWIMGWTEEKNPPVSRRGTPEEEMQPISENTQKLVDFVKTVPEDKAEYLLRVMKSILE